MRKFNYLKAFFSPFKRPKLKWYFGKIAIGTPYFYPRRWVKATPERAHEAVEEEIARIKRYNEMNIKHGTQRKIPPYDELFAQKMRCEYAVPKKFGFDFVGLGYKTKWDATDYRFEWSPIVSFVFWKWQIAVMVIPPEQNHYWEAWLYYENDTDKTKSRKTRVEQCREGFSLKYTASIQQIKYQVDYYETILKKKYL